MVDLLTSGSGKVETEVLIHLRGDGASLDDGTPINASGRHRHPTQRQKRVVKERDRRCVDCGSEDFIQYDYLLDFDESRRTWVDELQLRCSRCHRKRHKDAR